MASLRVIVQSATVDASYLDERIEAFFATVPSLLRAMSDAEFASHRDALVAAKLEAPTMLTHETQLYWGAIAGGTRDFHKGVKEAQALTRATRDDLLTHWMATFDAAAPHRRKLSSQVFAAHHRLPPRQRAGVNGRRIHYVDGYAQAVEYKRRLATYPPPARVDPRWA